MKEISHGSGCIRMKVQTQTQSTDESTLNKTTDEKTFDQTLGLGLENARLNFISELNKIFPKPTKAEATTFARMVIHFEAMVKSGACGVGIFDEAIGWAKTARQSTASNRKGLFVATVKDKTGFAKQHMLLGRGHHQRRAAEHIEFQDKKRKMLADLRQLEGAAR